MKKNIKGITLIALVITIIILLIITGVSIAMIGRNNGLINKSKQAKMKTENASISENNDLNSCEEELDKLGENSNDDDSTGELTGPVITIDVASHVEGVNGDFTAEELQTYLFDKYAIYDGMGALINKYYGDEAYIEFTVNKKTTLFAYGHLYSDAGGSSESNAIIKKFNGTSYEDYKVCATYTDGERYELTTLEAGKYRMYPEGRYISFDEWELDGNNDVVTKPAITINVASHVEGINGDFSADNLQKYLFDGNITYDGVGALINKYYGDNAYIEFTVDKNITLFAYGHLYSDGGGSSGSNAIIKKFNGTTYEDYKVCATHTDGEKYELATLEAGKYRMYPEGRYISFDEWETR